MAQDFTFIDVDQGTYNDKLVVDASTVEHSGTTGNWSIHLQRLRGGLSDGVDIIWLDNGRSRLAILPTRGMGVWKGEVDGIPLEWNSPVERPVHPMFVDQMRRGGIGWLDGFNELICRCGLSWHGAPGTDKITDESGATVSEQFLPLHGRIANLPAHKVSVNIADDGEISVSGVIDEASVFGGRLRLTSTISTYPGSNSFRICDVVENLGSDNAEVEMLYHCNIGRPFLGKGATVHTAATELAPRDARAAEGVEKWDEYNGPEAGFAEQVYFASPVADKDGQGLVVLRNPNGDRAFALRFDTDTLPLLAIWKNTQAEEDGYCTGLEPASSFPNLKTFERTQGRVISLPAGESISFGLEFTAALTTNEVDGWVNEASDLQKTAELTVHRQPKPDWSA